MPPKKNRKFLSISLAILLFGVAVYFALPMFYSKVEYSYSTIPTNTEIPQDDKSKDAVPTIDTSTPYIDVPVTHIKTPEAVKAIYLSAWVAGNPKYRNPLIKMIDETEPNAVVIDVKDSTGRISYQTGSKEINATGSTENRISNIRALTNTLHQKNIYVIGRVSVFQDPYMTKLKPEWAITRISDGNVWKDKKGLSFLDPSNKEVWKYIVSIAQDAYDQGFDEINFDYIRYPSDGDMKNINYRLATGMTRADNIEKFFIYLAEEMKKDENIPISADLFGLTTEVNNDMGIGQVWEKALPHFDFLSPMVYPSHYPPGSSGYKNPALYPYEIVSKALASAVKKTNAVQGQSIAKIRPWLQDFDLGATYTKEMVRAQMKATYDNGLDSWMLWDPSNKYTPSALLLEIQS